MANPTSNFGWQMPTNTDLVKDLPADFEVFGQAVDTSLMDLKGGTTGQILSKASNTDMDFTWIANDQGDITAVNVSSPITGGGTAGAVTVGIQDATTAQKGAVQLTDSISSTSTTTAATPNAVKTSYDLANAAIPKSLVDAKADLITATADNTPARLAVGNNGETLVADSSQTTGLRYNPPVGSLGNPVINGGMDVWQRGTSVSVSASTSPYTADRWQVSVGANQASTVARQTTSDTTNLPNIQYSARVQRNSGQTGTGTISLNHTLESTNSIPFAGKTVTLSFYARAGANFSASGSTLFSPLVSGTGTDQNYVSGFTGSATVANVGNTLTTSWQRFVVSGTVSTSATQLAVQFSYTPVGTAGANDWFEVTGVQLDVGTWTASTAPTFRRSGGTLAGELAACQRYYYRSIAGNSYGWLGNAIGQGTTTAIAGCPLPTMMRVVPTSVDYSTLSLVDGTNTVAVTNVVINTFRSSATVGTVDVTTASGLTQYRPYYLNQNASASGYIGFSAEL